MNEGNRSNPFTVVVGVDFCPPCEAAVRQALQMAGRYDDGHVHVVHVLDPSAGGSRRSVRIQAQEIALEELPARMRDYVAEQTRGIQQAGTAQLATHVRIGAPVDAMLQLAVDVQADVLVVGTHGREGLKRVMLGSVAEELVRTAHCPVLVARPIDYSGLQASERIAPPCPDCVATRKATAGAELWCERHRHERRDTHIYSGMAPVHWVAGSADVYGPGTSATQL